MFKICFASLIQLGFDLGIVLLLLEIWELTVQVKAISWKPWSMSGLTIGDRWVQRRSWYRQTSSKQALAGLAYRRSHIMSSIPGEAAQLYSATNCALMSLIKHKLVYNVQFLHNMRGFELSLRHCRSSLTSLSDLLMFSEGIWHVFITVL